MWSLLMVALGVPPPAPGNARAAWDFQISATAFGVSYVIEYTFAL
jgi:heme oxygenase